MKRYTLQQAANELTFVINQKSFKVKSYFTWEDMRYFADSIKYFVRNHPDKIKQIETIQSKFPFRKNY